MVVVSVHVVVVVVTLVVVEMELGIVSMKLCNLNCTYMIGGGAVPFTVVVTVQL